MVVRGKSQKHCLAALTQGVTGGPVCLHWMPLAWCSSPGQAKKACRGDTGDAGSTYQSSSL
eukprot:57112-Lingulodinium_polyedra.AAC.1